MECKLNYFKLNVLFTIVLVKQKCTVTATVCNCGLWRLPGRFRFLISVKEADERCTFIMTK